LKRKKILYILSEIKFDILIFDFIQENFIG